MAKIGRNALCPCGSGKKYKKCCGNAAPNKIQSNASSQASSPSKRDNSIEVKPMGLSGFRQYLITRPHYRDPNDPRNLGGPEGLAGKYKVVFTLNRPGFPLLPERQCSFASGLRGDSHLAITQPAYSNPNLPDATHIGIQVENRGRTITFTGYPNGGGFLGKLELESIDAENLRDASLKAHQLLMPALSSISMFLDVPLHIYQVDITELRTNSVQMSMMEPFHEAPFVDSLPKTMKDEYRKYASFYREALSSNSANYQFLCYFKIIEGIRERQKRLIEETKQKGEKVSSRPRQIIPQESEEQIKWLDSIYPVRQTWDEMALTSVFPKEAIGRRINDIIAKELDQIRNKIAHAILRSGEPTLSIDDALDIDLVYQWLPLTKCIARFLLKNEFPDVFAG